MFCVAWQRAPKVCVREKWIIGNLRGHDALSIVTQQPLHVIIWPWQRLVRPKTLLCFIIASKALFTSPRRLFAERWLISNNVRPVSLLALFEKRRHGRVYSFVTLHCACRWSDEVSRRGAKTVLGVVATKRLLVLLLFLFILVTTMAAGRNLNFLLLVGAVEVNALAQRALRRFTRWPWIEYPTFQLERRTLCHWANLLLFQRRKETCINALKNLLAQVRFLLFGRPRWLLSKKRFVGDPVSSARITAQILG